jgi:NADH-quinone oxidoreductase subunit M
LIVGILYERRHTRQIAEFGGISNVMPVYATITLIMFLSSLGLPLLNGFVGEFTILQGTFVESKAWAAWAVPGIILAAAYLLWLYQRVFFGPVNNAKNEKLADLSGRELATFVPLVLIAFWIGLYPRPFFQVLSTPVNNIVATVRPDYPGLNKPVVAAQAAARPDAATPLPQPPRALSSQMPAFTRNPNTTGVTGNEKQASMRTAKASITTTAAVPGK